MRRVAVVVLFAVVLAPSATATAPASGLPPSFVLVRNGPDGGTVWEGRIPDRQVDDPRLSDVYLPPGFSPAVRYPVIIFLHGFWGSPSSFVHGLHLAEAADAEITAGRAQPFIGVMPPGGPMTKTTSDEWAGVWENYIVRDVVPWVDAHFFTDRGAQSAVSLREVTALSTSGSATRGCFARWSPGAATSGRSWTVPSHTQAGPICARTRRRFWSPARSVSCDGWERVSSCPPAGADAAT